MAAKTYRAKTMKEALARVRRDLGGDAVILASNEVRRRRLFGLGKHDLIEVTAIDRIPESVSAANTVSSNTRVQQPRSYDGIIGTEPYQGIIGEELGRLHSMVEGLSRHGYIDHLLPDLPSELVATYAQLIEVDVPEILARRIVRYLADSMVPEQVHQPDALRSAMIETIEQCLPIAPPIRAIPGGRRVVAFVGPTGVGKTSTVAKLAASFKLSQGIRVGLITVDTYRIAAVEQLRAYADIIDLPLGIVTSSGEMARAVEELGPVDLVLVDTAGRAPRDEPRIRELSNFLNEARPDETHLLLNVGAGQKALRTTVEGFSAVRVDRLILTKLDEADGLGGVLSAVAHADRPISYVTKGQSVPDDFEPADRRRLARLILGQESLS